MIIIRRDGSRETYRETLDEIINKNILADVSLIDTIVNIVSGKAMAYIITTIDNGHGGVIMLEFNIMQGIILYERRILTPLSPIDKDEADKYMDMYNDLDNNIDELFDQLKTRGLAIWDAITNAGVNTRPISKVKRS